MTKRATFTQAELDRAIRVADRHGRAVAIIGGAILFVDPDRLPALPSPDSDGENTCDKLFGEPSG